MKQENLGELLINLRKENHYTQDDISRKMHVTRQAVSKWENNTALPDVFTIVKLGKLYNAPLLSAFYGEEFASEFTSLLRQRMFKRLLAIWIAVSTCLLFIFGFYYAYHHEKVYTYELRSEDDRLITASTYAKISKKESIIKLGDLTLDNKPISSYIDVKYHFYYIENGEMITIIRFSKGNEVKLSDSVDYVKLFSDFVNNKKQLHLQISYTDNRKYNEFDTEIITRTENELNFLANDDDIDKERSITTYIKYPNYNQEYLSENGFSLYDRENMYKDLSISSNSQVFYYVSKYGDYILSHNDGCSYRFFENRIIYSCDEFFKTICFVFYDDLKRINYSSCAINSTEEQVINYLWTVYNKYHDSYYNGN